MVQPIAIRDASINLDQFLKLASVAGSGGQVRLLVDEGAVRVNGEPEPRRRRKLQLGDVVEVDQLGLFEVVSGKPD
ncbi:MAG: RNA-binding S4 domain-containing protein [Phycisphaeraceae bacterium]